MVCSATKSNRIGKKYLQFYTLLLFLGFLELSTSEGARTLNRTPVHERQRPQADHPWIGSHTLQFTPNPFLQQKSRSQSTADVSESTVVQATAESPLLVPLSSSTTTTESPIDTQKKVRKGRRKVKGRRRLHNRNNKKNANFTNIILRRPRPKLELESPITPKAEETVKEESTQLFNGFNNDKIEFFPIDQVSLSPTLLPQHQRGSSIPVSSPSRLPVPVEEFISITTPEPMRMNNLGPMGPDYNQIAIDFSAHPEKLNPSYFRNIILKAMMDRLVGVGVVTRVPSPVRRV